MSQNSNKSLQSLSDWKQLKELIDKKDIIDMFEFENIMAEQDEELQLELFDNISLMNRAKDYVEAKHKHMHITSNDDVYIF